MSAGTASSAGSGTNTGSQNQQGGGGAEYEGGSAEQKQTDEQTARAEAEKKAREDRRANVINKLVVPPTDDAFKALKYKEILNSGQSVEDMQRALESHASPVPADIAEKLAKVAYYVAQADDLIADESNAAFEQAIMDGLLDRDTFNQELARIITEDSQAGVTRDIQEVRVEAAAIALQKKAEAPPERSQKEIFVDTMSEAIDKLARPDNLTDTEWEEIQRDLKAIYNDEITDAPIEGIELERLVFIHRVLLQDETNVIADRLRGTQFGQKDVSAIVAEHRILKQQARAFSERGDMDSLLPANVKDEAKSGELLNIEIEVVRLAMVEKISLPEALTRFKTETFQRLSNYDLNETDVDENEGLRFAIEKHPFRMGQVLKDRLRYIQARRKAEIIAITDSADFAKQHQTARESRNRLQSLEEQLTAELTAARERGASKEETQEVRTRLRETKRELHSAQVDLALFNEEAEARAAHPGEEARLQRATAHSKVVGLRKKIYDRQLGWLRKQGRYPEDRRLFDMAADHLEQMPDLYYYNPDTKTWIERPNIGAAQVAAAETHIFRLGSDIWKKKGKKGLGILIILLQALGISTLGTLLGEAGGGH